MSDDFGAEKDLGTYALTTAVTNEVITEGVSSSGVAQEYVSGLAGALSANFDVNFTYGSGGTTLKVDIETSLNQGTTWVPVYRAAFTTTSGNRVINLSGLTPKTSPLTPATLSDDTAVDGVLGDRWRVRVTSTGTYAGNSSVAVRAQFRG